MQNQHSASLHSSSLQVTPIAHATMVLHLGDQVIYTDPVGGAEAFTGQPGADVILVTDIHPDHFNAETLRAVTTDDTVLVVPQAVADQLPKDLQGTLVIMHNGDTKNEKGITIDAIPMYNLPESPESFHTKGRGNGYVLSKSGERVYIAGDTDAIPEMKALQNIDVAFVPMNLPYTMSVEEAAGAVLAFQPNVVHPYHYRGPEGLSDCNKFKQLVESSNPDIQVDLLNFYPKQ